MTDMMSGVPNTEDADTPQVAAGGDGLDDQLLDQLVSRARTGGLQLTGEGGMFQRLTKRLLESALEGEITDHLGHDPGSWPSGRNA